MKSAHNFWIWALFSQIVSVSQGQLGLCILISCSLSQYAIEMKFPDCKGRFHNLPYVYIYLLQIHLQMLPFSQCYLAVLIVWSKVQLNCQKFVGKDVEYQWLHDQEE